MAERGAHAGMYMLLQERQYLVTNPVARNLQAVVGPVDSKGPPAGLEIVKELRPGPAQQRPHQPGGSFLTIEGPAGRDPGQPAFRARQLYRQLYTRCAGSIEEMTDLPTELRERMAGESILGAMELVDVRKGDQGLTRKAIWCLPGGETIESVLGGPPPEDLVAKLPGPARAQRLCLRGGRETNAEKLRAQRPGKLTSKALVPIRSGAPQGVVDMADVAPGRSIPEGDEVAG